MMNNNKYCNTVLFSALISLCTLVHGAAFQLNDKSAATLGRANAGTAVADDMSVQFWNPAATTQFDQMGFSVVGSLIKPHNSYEVVRSLRTRVISQVPVDGEYRALGEAAFVPSIFAIYPINDSLVASLGITVPFGLSTDYGKDSKARYFATNSSISSLNLNPAIAVKLNEHFSIGAGLNVMRLEAELNQAIDVGRFFKGAEDAYIFNKANSWGYGWNMGVLFQVENSKVGISYRSAVNQQLKGNSIIENISDLRRNMLGLFDSSLTVNITMPDTLIFSTSHQLSEKMTLMFDAQFTRWSVIDEITLEFDTPKKPDQTLVFNFQDTWRLALGNEYQVNEKLKLRSGVAYDQTPVNRRHMSLRLPDTDRYWLSVGFGYDITENMTIDAGYTRIFFTDPLHILQESENKGNLFEAIYKPTANLVAVQFSMTFN